jgi:hypothetical protein
MTTLQTENLKVLAIDPGIMTGYCQAMIKRGQLHYIVYQRTDEVDDLWRRLEELEPRFIVCESFEFRGGHHRAATGIEYFPIQLIGVARLYGEIGGDNCATFMQTPAQGKGYYTNKMLKDGGYLKRGMATNVPHGIDAMRHLFQWFTFGAGYKYNEAKAGEPFAVMHDSWRYIEG